MWYLLLNHCLCPVIFNLNGFNSVLASCCQRTEKAQPLSFRGHQSFIITRIHQPIQVITDYKQSFGKITHMHTPPTHTRTHTDTHAHTHTAVWLCVMSRIRNTFTLLKHALLPHPPPFTGVLLNTLELYKIQISSTDSGREIMEPRIILSKQAGETQPGWIEDLRI